MEIITANKNGGHYFMEEKSNKNCTEQMLEELIKNLAMGKQALMNIIPKAKSDKLRDELTSQLDGYGKYCEEAKTMLDSIGGEPKSENIFAKLGSKIGIEMNTLMDPTDAHVAQMVIEGATMGITDTIRLVREYENSSCSDEALSLARRTVSYQEKVVEDMKKYL